MQKQMSTAYLMRGSEFKKIYNWNDYILLVQLIEIDEVLPKNIDEFVIKNICTADIMHKWINKYHICYRYVAIPDEAQIVLSDDDTIAHVIGGNISCLHNIWNDIELCTKMIKNDGMMLSNI